MLSHLAIRDLAVIDAAELDFSNGFTVLTGETGAGKSILIDAIGLLLGDRADASLVRDGAEAAELSAELQLDAAPQASAWLEEQAMTDADDPLLVRLRRVVSRDGRSRAFVNGRSVPLGSLRELGELLIEIHGQHEHQRLMKSAHQRELLDAWAGHDELLAAVADAASAWRRLKRELEALRQRAAVDPSQLELLRHQAAEIESLALTEGEIPALEEEQRRLANAGELIQTGGQAMEGLYGGDDALYDALGRVRGLLERLAGIDPAFDEVAQMVDQAGIQVEEAAQSLRRALERTDLDPERLDTVEQRMGAIHDLARKHRVRPEALPERLAELQAEVSQAERGSEDAEKLERELEITLQRYRKAATKLGRARSDAAGKLSGILCRSLATLGMRDARLVVTVESDPQTSPSAAGDDEVRIDFSANPGQAPRPLARVASGGELSRISLAIQVAVSAAAGVPVMIFDEVDAGVGGGTAEIVGALLRELSGNRQVLCVTHLPQVAAQGARHYRIEKQSQKGQTRTRVTPLDAAAREEELSRMLGGVEITESTRALARDMLARAAR